MSERNGPVFIGGTGRSGTTLLARLIGSHSRIFGFKWETQFIVSPGGLIDLFTTEGDSARYERFVENLLGRWFERVLRAGTRSEYRAGLIADVRPRELEEAVEFFINRTHHSPTQVSLDAARHLVEDIAEGPMQRARAKRWCEKTPRNILYASELALLFPDMRLVHIIRDGRDVAASIAANGFWPIAASADIPALASRGTDTSAENAARYWKVIIQLARERMDVLAPDHYLELRFEDLVRSPEKTLANLCEFIDEPFDVQMLRAIELRSERIGRWRQELSGFQVEQIHEDIGDALIAEGYEI